MRKMTSAKLKMAARLRPLVPMKQLRLEKEKVEPNKWTANWVSDPDGTRYEVCHYETRLDMDLPNQSYTCRMQHLTSISLSQLNLSILDIMYCIIMNLMCFLFIYTDLPCRHTIVVIRYNNHILEDYSDDMLTIGSYNATYENYILPTKSQQYWEKTTFNRPTSPHNKKRPSRSKNVEEIIRMRNKSTIVD